ncbi:MAG: cysteine hydrolase [Deltaproteobacteria bacterium]|nr:cysteine hydrolase [Deltaproteobacteria bacterium]
MQPAIIVVDMVKDNFLENTRNPITPLARAVLPRVNELTAGARERGWPVVFACDSFLPGDFLFKGKMKECSLRGQPGSQVTDLLDMKPGDVYLPKRRFSAFFKTDLDQTLRLWSVDTAVVCGIATHFCVLSTAFDALCLDFRAIIVEDASASYSAELHQQTLGLFRKNPLYPLFQVLTVEQVLQPAP